MDTKGQECIHRSGPVDSRVTLLEPPELLCGDWTFLGWDWRGRLVVWGKVILQLLMVCCPVL